MHYYVAKLIYRILTGTTSDSEGVQGVRSNMRGSRHSVGGGGGGGGGGGVQVNLTKKALTTFSFFY